MSPGIGMLNPPHGAEGLEFVDELKRDISSYLLQNPDDAQENDLLQCLLNKGVLCYACPDDCGEDRWRAARADDAQIGSAPQEATVPPASASPPATASTSPPASAADISQGGRLTQTFPGFKPAASSSASSSSSRPSAFGAPPSSDSIRWPLRPQEHSRRGFGGLGQFMRNCRSPDHDRHGARSDSNDSNSVESCGSDAGTRRGRARGSQAAPTHVGERQPARRAPGGGSGYHSMADALQERQARGQQRQMMRDLSEGRLTRGRQYNRGRTTLRGRACVSADLHRASSSSRSSDELPRAPQVNMSDLLEFTSCFESSNLQYAVYNHEDSAYDLVLENDVHTRGHTQWFYFAVRNGRLGQTVRLRIVNMSKAKSLFRMGMKPLVWSESDAAQHPSVRHSRSSSSSSHVFPLDVEPASQLWRQRGENVKYVRTKAGNTSRYHTLVFEYTFEKAHDTVFFAYCVPYSYSMLRSTLVAIVLDPVSSPRCRCRSLCTTTGNVKCELVEITNFAISRRRKKAVVVSSRVHPGESNASWLVSGLITFLLSDSIEAQVLRDHFVWQIVPMLNPDGVICGNYRCGLTGVDLNRQWRRPHQDLHGTIYKVKRLIAAAKRKAHLCIYMDLHGHSRKCGIFSYACGNFPKDDYRRFSVRMFPKLLSMLTPEFEFAHCRWRVGKGKRGTGRVVVAKDLGLVNTYTIEASFWGSVVKEKPEAQPLHRTDSGVAQEELAEEADDERKEKGGGSDSEGSDKEGAAAKPGVVDVAETVVVPPSRMIIFTPSKLQEMGMNLARALLLQQNLGPKVQAAIREAARQKEREAHKKSEELDEEKTAATAPLVDVAVARNTPSDSGNSTPSGASEANASESEDEEAFFNSAKAAEASLEAVAPSTAASSDPLPAASEAKWEDTPYLGIDVAEVLHELKVNPLESETESASGSDSAPSDDNLAPQELHRLTRLFSRKRKSTSAPPSGHGAAASTGRKSHDNHKAAHPPTSPTRAKSDHNTTSSRWSPAKRKSKTSERKSRSECRSPPLAHPVEMRSTLLQRTVAFGQTTYVDKSQPGRGAPSPPASVAASRSHASSSPTIDKTSEPVSPVSPPFTRSFSDPQALSFYGDEKDRDRGHRRHGWSQQGPWPPIPAASGRSGRADQMQLSGGLGGSNSEAYCLLGSPPKDRFAFAQGGAGDTRRSQAGSTGRLTLTHMNPRMNEEASSTTRSKNCIRNASNTMLGFAPRTCAPSPPLTQAIHMNAIPDALLTGIAFAMPPQGSGPPALGPERQLANLRNLVANTGQRPTSRPGTANARTSQRASTDAADADVGASAAVDGGAGGSAADAGDPEEGPASARAQSGSTPSRPPLAHSEGGLSRQGSNGSLKTTSSLRQELLRYIRKC